MAEHVLLNDIIDRMEENGQTYKTVILDIDDKFLDQVNLKNKDIYTLQQLEKAADKCLAHEWLEKINSGRVKYAGLRITPKGMGVARSKKRADELKSKRSRLKKTSDYIEDHKGLSIVVGILLALATLSLKFLGEK